MKVFAFLLFLFSAPAFAQLPTVERIIFSNDQIFYPAEGENVFLSPKDKLYFVEDGEIKELEPVIAGVLDYNDFELYSPEWCLLYQGTFGPQDIAIIQFRHYGFYYGCDQNGDRQYNFCDDYIPGSFPIPHDETYAASCTNEEDD